MKTREQRIEAAQMKVLFTVPFFASGVMKLPVRIDSSVDTACTDGTGIVWNGEWFDKLSDPELVTVLAHEVTHCMLGHLWRAPSGCDWDTWNQATDHAVNLMLSEFGAQVKARGLADPFPFPPPPDSYCANPAFSGMPEEQIYGILASQAKQGGGSKPGGSQSGGAPNKTPPRASGSVKPGSGTPSKGSMPSFGQMQAPKSGTSPSSSKKLRNDWDGTLIQACTMARGRGELPGGMERFVGELVNPQVPWTDVLRSWLREQCSDDWDFLTPDLTMDESGFILPSLKSEKMGPVVFLVDSSGSINLGLLAKFKSEMANCMDELRPSKLVEIIFDAKIQRETEYFPGDAIKPDAPGGGGTSFVEPLRRCSDMQPAPKCVVCLTDLDGAMPKEAPDFPVIWCAYGGAKEAPFGTVVQAD